MNQVGTSPHTVLGIKPKIIKGEENRSVQSNIDANKMAQLEADRAREQEMLKKEKIESFMNSTRINASKIYKEQCSKNQQQISSKKEIMDKQKQLKAKYTVVNKKTEPSPQVISQSKSPSKVNWKQAENTRSKVHIPQESLDAGQSSGDQSAYDSEVDRDKNQTPEQVSANRLKLKKLMLQKCRKT